METLDRHGVVESALVNIVWATSSVASSRRSPSKFGRRQRSTRKRKDLQSLLASLRIDKQRGAGHPHLASPFFASLHACERPSQKTIQVPLQRSQLAKPRTHRPLHRHSRLLSTPQRFHSLHHFVDCGREGQVIYCAGAMWEGRFEAGFAAGGVKESCSGDCVCGTFG